VKKRKEPYVVVFDPATGLKRRSRHQKIKQPTKKKDYGQLRIRSGSNSLGLGGGGVEWMVWSITDKKWHINIDQGDLNEAKLRAKQDEQHREIKSEPRSKKGKQTGSAKSRKRGRKG